MFHPSSTVARGVLLYHHLPDGHSTASHLDLLVEVTGDPAGRLWCWSWEGWPVAGESLLIVTKPLHRADYLSYQGEVSGGRGSVVRLDQGKVRWERRSRSRWLCRLEFQQLAALVELPCPDDVSTEHLPDDQAELTTDPPVGNWRVSKWSAGDGLLGHWNQLVGCR